MFKNDFIVKVKVDGQVMPEDGDRITIPFNSEYSIYLHNLRGQKASVAVSIDGHDVLDGNRLIVAANDFLELERFLVNMDQGHKFKFLRKTDKMRAYRNDQPADGIVRVAYRFEAVKQEVPIIKFPTVLPYNPWPIDPYYCDGTMVYSSSSSQPLFRVSSSTAGITGNGGISNQCFRDGYIDVLETTEHVISFQLVGTEPVKKEYLDDIKAVLLVCSKCGTVNLSALEICCECGNCLTII